MAKALQKFLPIFLLCLLIGTLCPLLSAEALNLYPPDTDYHQPEDLLPLFQKLHDRYPDLLRWEIIGSSSNHHYPIYAVNVTAHYSSSPKSKPALLFHGQHHGEEPIGVEIVLYMMQYFLANYLHDNFITQLLDNYSLWFVPTSNPEGFAITNRGEYRLKRKNETNVLFNRVRDFSRDGIDLNRNYPFNWDRDDSSESSQVRESSYPFRFQGLDEFLSFEPTSVFVPDNADSPYFKGYEAACQNETRVMIDLYEKNRFKLAFFYHSSATGAYSERIFFPWKWGDTISPDYNEMLHLARVLGRNLPLAYQRGTYRVQQFNTSPRGFARDYIYSQHRTLAMLIEVGGNSPYGEGVINPDNHTLWRHKTSHTSAMLKLLQEFDKNIMEFLVVDEREEPVIETEIAILDKRSPDVKPLRTDTNGIFHYFLLPRPEPYQIFIDEIGFLVNKPKPEKGSLTFKLPYTIPKSPSFQPLNKGEAIILLNQVFQYYPPIRLSTDDLLNRTPKKAYITIMSAQKKAYREAVEISNNELILPLLPTNNINIADLHIQYRDIHPRTDRTAINNKLVVAGTSNMAISYCSRISDFDYYYFYPGTAVGIDYTLYPGANNIYNLQKIALVGNFSDADYKLRLSVYDGTRIITQTNTFKITDEKFLSFDFVDLELPNNLYIVIENIGHQMLILSRDSHYSGYTPSRRSRILSSHWRPLEGTDLAITVHLESREDARGYYEF